MFKFLHMNGSTSYKLLIPYLQFQSILL